MADETIKAGDTVTLKSGGPRMTVMAVGGSSTSAARCVWFDPEAHPYTMQEADILVVALTKVGPGDVF